LAQKAGEHNIGLLERSGLSKTKFADQAVLTSTPGALDAALGLRRIRRDLLDAEFCKSVSELSGRLLSGELFGKGPVSIVALKDGVAVVVKTERDSMGGDHGVQGAKITDGIFGFELEVSRQDLAGSVVLKTDEGERGAAAFEPIVTAGIGEDHHAETWAGRASGAIFTRPALLRRSQPGSA
jgi:hypothetical protein